MRSARRTAKQPSSTRRNPQAEAVWRSASPGSKSRCRHYEIGSTRPKSSSDTLGHRARGEVAQLVEHTAKNGEAVSADAWEGARGHTGVPLARRDEQQVSAVAYSGTAIQTKPAPTVIAEWMSAAVRICSTASSMLGLMRITAPVESTAQT